MTKILERGFKMKKFVLIVAVLFASTFGTVASAEKTLVPVFGNMWAVDLATVCQPKQVILRMKNGVEAAMMKKDGRLLVNGLDSGIACPLKVVKKRRGGGSGGSTFVSNLEVAVHPDGTPVLNPGEVVVPVGNTNTGNTPVTGIGGTGPYTPVNDQPATAPDVEPVDTTSPEEVAAGFGPVNN